MEYFAGFCRIQEGNLEEIVMIMVDVNVPSIGRQYDFSRDEQAKIAQLIP